MPSLQSGKERLGNLVKPNLVQHLESHLGLINEGWGDTSEIKVVAFRDQPHQGVVTYLTLGLSDYLLPMTHGRKVRQELLVSVYSRYNSKDVAAFLVSFSEYIVSQNRALLRGDVVGPSQPLVPNVSANAVYASIPVFFEDDFRTFDGSSPPTVFVWLIPLPSSDAEFVKQSGWDAFEDRLEASEVDFWDLDRVGL
jgi:hypothetical protein